MDSAVKSVVRGNAALASSPRQRGVDQRSAGTVVWEERATLFLSSPVLPWSLQNAVGPRVQLQPKPQSSTGDGKWSGHGGGRSSSWTQQDELPRILGNMRPSQEGKGKCSENALMSEADAGLLSRVEMELGVFPGKGRSSLRVVT